MAENLLVPAVMAKVQLKDKRYKPGGISSPPVSEPTILPIHDTDNIIIDRIQVSDGHVRYFISKPGKEKSERWSVQEKDLHHWVSDRTREKYEEERLKAEEPDPSEREARADRKAAGKVTPKAKEKPGKKGTGQWGWSRKKKVVENDPTLPTTLSGIAVVVKSPSRTGRDLLQGGAADTEDEDDDVDSIEDLPEDTQRATFDDTTMTLDSTELALNRQLGGTNTRVLGKKYPPGPSRLSNQITISPSESETEPMDRQVTSTSMLPLPIPANRGRPRKSMPVSTSASAFASESSEPNSMMPPSASFTSSFNAQKKRKAPEVDGSFMYMTKRKGKETENEVWSPSTLPESPTAFAELGSGPRASRSRTTSSRNSRPGTSDSANSATEPARKKLRRDSAAASYAVEPGSLHQALEREEKSMKRGVSKKIGSIDSRYSKFPKKTDTDSEAEAEDQDQPAEALDEDEDEEKSGSPGLGDGVYLIKEILADRYTFDKAGNPIREYQILWEGDWPASENPTWEPEHMVGADAMRDFERSRRPKAAFPDIIKKGKRAGRKIVDAGEPTAKRSRRKSATPASLATDSESEVGFSKAASKGKPKSRKSISSKGVVNRRASRSASAATEDEESMFMPSLQLSKRNSKSPYFDSDGDRIMSERPRTRDSTSSKETKKKSVRFSQSTLDASEDQDDDEDDY